MLLPFLGGFFPALWPKLCYATQVPVVPVHYILFCGVLKVGLLSLRRQGMLRG